MNMQLRQCLARAKPFRLKKNKKPDFDCIFDFKKSRNFKIWFQKFQIGNPARNQQQHGTTIASQGQVLDHLD